MYEYANNQDNTRTRVLYHRTQGREITLGWDLDTADANQKYGCALLESAVNGAHLAEPVCVEPYNAAAVTCTPATTGGHMGAGWVRLYFGYRGVDYPTVTRYGGVDHTNYKDVLLTGTNNVNSIAITGMLAGTWEQTDRVCIYRTKVVSSQAQLPYENAYLEIIQTDATLTATGGAITDAVLITQMLCQLGKYGFPSDKQHSKFYANLGIAEHKQQPMVWGVMYPWRLYGAGYTDSDGEVDLDFAYWGYTWDMPGQDTIVCAVSVGGKFIILGEYGVYQLMDDDYDPNNWEIQQIGSLRGANAYGMVLSDDKGYMVVRGANGEWNIYEADVYQFRPIGDVVAGKLDSSTGLISLDGYPVCVTGANSRRYAMIPYGLGRPNIPDATKWSLGRYSTFVSGAPLLATTAGVYYEGATYSTDGSDYVATREYIDDPVEDETADRLWVHAIKTGATSCTATVQISRDGAAYATLPKSPITISTTDRGVYDVGVDAANRNCKRYRVKVACTANAGIVIEGFSMQVKPTEQQT
jgi:hypothetical protein